MGYLFSLHVVYPPRFDEYRRSTFQVV